MRWLESDFSPLNSTKAYLDDSYTSFEFHLELGLRLYAEAIAAGELSVSLRGAP